VTDVKKGDRVRVVVEGVATYCSSGGNLAIGVDSTHTLHTIVTNHPSVVSVEVLTKQFKVGDTVSGDDYAKLPVGTVVKHREHAHVRVKVAENYWIDPSEPALERPNHWLRKCRTIVHLP
jgi:hypothetical protein